MTKSLRFEKYNAAQRKGIERMKKRMLKWMRSKQVTKRMDKMAEIVKKGGKLKNIVQTMIA